MIKLFSPGPFQLHFHNSVVSLHQSLSSFNRSKDAVPDEMRELDKPYAMASLGLQITLYVVHLTRFDTPIATLSCRYETELQWLLGFRIWLHDSSSFSRHGPSFVQMYTEGLISPQFTFALSQSGGYIVLGATEMSSSFADHERLHLNET